MTPGGSLNEQIVVALARLQDDMQSVLERLHTLEALTASQVRPVSPLVHYLQKTSCMKRVMVLEDVIEDNRHQTDPADCAPVQILKILTSN